MFSEPLGSKGIQFFYEDSGAPQGSAAVYTTLVIIHGTNYHSGIFHRFLPLVADHNLRLVLLNRRDYPGTTNSTAEELEKLRGPSQEDQAEALQALGLEIADFLRWYIRNTDIPPMADDGEVGGVAVLAWSSGNFTGLSMVANLDQLSEEKRKVFREYLRSFIIYDCPMYGLGFQPPPEIYNPFSDPSIPNLQERIARFNVFITSYFHHPDIESRSISGLAQQPISNPTPDRVPTIYRLSPADLDSTTYPEALTRGYGIIRYLNLEVYTEQTRKIFFDEESMEMFPRLKIKLIWCRNSIMETPLAAWALEDAIVEFVKQGGKGRMIEVYDMPGNHFAHWYQPEQIIQFFANVV